MILLGRWIATKSAWNSWNGQLRRLKRHTAALPFTTTNFTATLWKDQQFDILSRRWWSVFNRHSSSDPHNTVMHYMRACTHESDRRCLAVFLFSSLFIIDIQFLALPSNKRPYDEALHFQYRRINNNYHGSNVPRILTCPIGSRSGAWALSSTGLPSVWSTRLGPCSESLPSGKLDTRQFIGPMYKPNEMTVCTGHINPTCVCRSPKPFDG